MVRTPASSYLNSVEHLQIDGFDLFQLLAQGDESVLLLVGVLFQQLHCNFHFGFHADL